jgi:hypothetical protein
VSEANTAATRSRDAIQWWHAAVQAVRDAIPAYNWDCTPGRWLVYTLLLALPFPAKVVRPYADYPVWFCKPKRRVKGVVPGLDLTGMPAELPDLPDTQCVMSEFVGQLFDSVIPSLSNTSKIFKHTW